MESPSVILMIYFFIASDGWLDAPKILFIIVWLSHYAHRTFIYPFTITSKNKPYPVLLVLFAVVFNMMNGFLNGYEVFHLNFYSNHWFQSPILYVGLALFIIGYVINKRSDYILSHLKRDENNGYVIPQGGMFKWVSSPHYLGEIIEWTGWAIMTWSISGLAFAIFTFANLAPRAITAHKWYKEQFPDYPKDRKGLIPHLW
jgi:protein-S-isoprenylcysteine O-methyltransferase Ste14